MSVSCIYRIPTFDQRHVCAVFLSFVDRHFDCPCCFVDRNLDCLLLFLASSSADRPQRSEDGSAAKPPLPPATNRGGKVLPKGEQILGDFCDF